MLRLVIPLFLVLILRSFAIQKKSSSNASLAFYFYSFMHELIWSNLKRKKEDTL